MKLVCKLDDENSVFSNEADEGHEADLGVDVEGRRPPVCPKRHIGGGHLEEREKERAEHRHGHRAEEDDEGVPKAIKLCR